MRIRLRRPADDATVVLRREAVTDPRLSLTAVGVLAVLTALPDERSVTVADLLNRSGEDPAVVQAALDALEAAGYLHVDPDIGPDGEAYLSDRPAAPPPRAASSVAVTRSQHQHGPPAATPAAPAPPRPSPTGRPDPPPTADEAARAEALARIRRTLAASRRDQSRHQAQTEAAVWERLAAAAEIRRAAAAQRAAAEEALRAEPATDSPDTPDGQGPGPAGSP